MVTTRSSKNKTNTQVSNNTDKNVVVDEVHNASVPNNESDSDSDSEYEYESNCDSESEYEYSNYSTDDSEDVFDPEKNKTYLEKKKIACNIIQKHLDKIEQLRSEGTISKQCRSDENPEFIKTIFILYDTVMENDIYLSYKGEKKFDKLYEICIDRLYHITRALIITFERPDLAYNIYNKYKDYYNLRYYKIFSASNDNTSDINHHEI